MFIAYKSSAICSFDDRMDRQTDCVCKCVSIKFTSVDHMLFASNQSKLGNIMNLLTWIG